ncbi:hypothetical protein FAM09_23855 [Niastella caeni]|uniref:Six-hairpin glycosidase-like protein n=1 Tax=Niastella caeni TaxID=2569763 RepID=A0A4S8HIG8_9BACT|nr:hypothetical protein [Niastella caeni]THU34059.1 hypothetical protein FAM09_23855 [Niastella caeni]
MNFCLVRKSLNLLICLSSFTCALYAQQSPLPVQQDRWRILPDGSIEWPIDNRLPHNDHVEMSGEKISMWVQYGVNAEGQSSLNRTMVFPTFRLLPVRTIASMTYNVTDGDLPRFLINDKLLKAGVYNAAVATDMPEKVVSVRQKGILQINSEIGKDRTIVLQRTLFPSVDKPVAIEKWVFTNTGKQPVKIEMEYLYREVRPALERTTPVQHSFVVTTANEGLKVVAPGDSVQFAVLYQASNKDNPLGKVDVNAAQSARQQRVNGILSLLQLETPDPVLNAAFAFACIRATESIYKTKGGYLHGPGGLRYYAAIWANDQAEYINPFFGMLGDETGNKSAMNAYRWFARYMNDEYKPIPSSIIAEGDATWHGAKDRGDMAMIAYGAARYALTYGNVDSAKVLWPLIEWCLEYLKRKVNEQGVVTSNSDELEGRFPAGKANLHTSTLYYDALRSAVILGKLLQVPKAQTDRYIKEAQEMRLNIEKFFGATVEGFKTYRYYEGNDTLRAWICTPLTVGIYERKEGTVAALFSPRLWTEDGLASLAGNTTFWDRSTLYALRGVLAAGETEKAMQFLRYYSRRRLLGEHVPYPVEAYPEGNQRHLSAESGLYCRIFTEGLFGIRPAGFNSFECSPRLPNGWDQMALKNVHAFGNVFDLKVSRAGADKLGITIIKGQKEKKYVIREGATQQIQL